MAYLLRISILSLHAYMYSGLGCGQNQYDFKKFTKAMIGNTFISKQTNVTSMIQCALLCSSTLSCEHAQYCVLDHVCAFYELCAQCQAIPLNCLGGRQPLTALLTGPSSRIAEPPVCAGHKYLVSGPQGVGDNQLSQSSYYNDIYEFCSGGRYGRFARLNSTFPCSSWSPATDGPEEYVQVNFRTVKLTTGVELAGRINNPTHEPGHGEQYVTDFTVLYSEDCTTFTPIRDSVGKEQVFAGCSYVTDVVKRCFQTIVPARCIRINPTGYSGWKSMRFDIFGY